MTGSPPRRTTKNPRVAITATTAIPVASRALKLNPGFITTTGWSGRVLVERLEGFATEEEWRRADAEINDFEEILVRRGILLLKFWMHISSEEQLRRFKSREKVPFKKYKISTEDYRNRQRWNAYELAADEMVQRTSTDYARWHLVSANDKRWARIHLLKTVCREVTKAL